MVTIPVTAVVVGYNEYDVLEGCLESAKFCERRIYLDLGSKDRSVDIARSLGWETRVVPHRPGVEMTLAPFIAAEQSEWFLLLDPDERIHPNLARFLCDNFNGLAGQPSTAGIAVDWRFWFGKKRLHYGPWSNNRKILVVRKSAFFFRPISHRMKVLRDGFRVVEVDTGKDLAIDHHWVTGWTDLAWKHGRYLKLEFRGQGKTGERNPLFSASQTAIKQSKKAFAQKHAHRDGLVGVLLGVFWVLFQSLSVLLAGISRGKAERESEE